MIAYICAACCFGGVSGYPTCAGFLYISFILFLHTFFIPRHLRFWGAGPAIQSPGNHGGPRVNAEDFVASGEAAMLSW